MKRKIVRLTESQLQKVIKESVKKILKENSDMEYEEDRYSIYQDGEFADSTNDLQRAEEIAMYLFGKGYSDDIVIWDNLTDEEVTNEEI